MHHLHRPSASSTTRSTGAASAMVARASNDIDPSRVVSAPGRLPGGSGLETLVGRRNLLLGAQQPAAGLHLQHLDDRGDNCKRAARLVALDPASRVPLSQLSWRLRTSITTLWSSTHAATVTTVDVIAAVRAHRGREQFRIRRGRGRIAGPTREEWRPTTRRARGAADAGSPGAGKSNSVLPGSVIRKRVICGVACRCIPCTWRVIASRPALRVPAGPGASTRFSQCGEGVASSDLRPPPGGTRRVGMQVDVQVDTTVTGETIRLVGSCGTRIRPHRAPHGVGRREPARLRRRGDRRPARRRRRAREPGRRIGRRRRARPCSSPCATTSCASKAKRALAPGQSEVRVDDLTAQILAAVVDEWDFSAQDGNVRFACTRRVPAPSA